MVFPHSPTFSKPLCSKLFVVIVNDVDVIPEYTFSALNVYIELEQLKG